MTNPTHAQRGVPMALMWRQHDCYAALINWTGERLESVDGKEWRYTDAWLKGGMLLYRHTPAGWQPVLPPKDEPDAIEVGSQWEHKSDGEQCVVCDSSLHAWVALRYEESDAFSSTRKEDFLKSHTHLFTPAKDLSNVPDGAKIVCMETGEVVTKWIDDLDCIELLDEAGDLHSVNGLPSWANPATGSWEIDKRGQCHCETGPADSDGQFWLKDKRLSPEEWGHEIATNPKYDASKVLPEYRHLLPAEEPEPETVVISECDRETGIPTAPDLELPAGMPLPEQVEAINAHFTSEPETVVADHIPDGGEKFPLSIQDLWGYSHACKFESYELDGVFVADREKYAVMVTLANGERHRAASFFGERSLVTAKYRIAKEAADE